MLSVSRRQFLVLFLSSLKFGSWAATTTKLEFDESELEDPETTPGLYQGDIAIDTNMDSFLRVGLHWEVFQNRMWANRTVPYVISPLYDAEDHFVIMSAIRSLNFMTCLRFGNFLIEKFK